MGGADSTAGTGSRARAAYTGGVHSGFIMRHRLASRAAAIALALAFSPVVHAGGGPFGIDHLVEYDDSGIRKRSNQVFLQNATALVVVGGALWEGDDTRLGHTYWQALSIPSWSAWSRRRQ